MKTWRVIVQDDNNEPSATLYVVAESASAARETVENVLSDFHHVAEVITVAELKERVSA